MKTQKTLKIGFIGAGGIHFGSKEGPWNHSKRLKLIENIIFTAVCDPNIELANLRIIEEKWSHAKAFSDYKLMLDSDFCPDAVFIGVPPACHGDIEGMEIQCARKGLHIFIDKPISIRPIEEVKQVNEELIKLSEANKLIISVGYMLRYNNVFQKAIDILKKYQKTPVLINARYYSAYTQIKKSDWWNRCRSGGPIIEQATHFLDIMRYLGGDIDLDSIRSVAVGPSLSLEDMKQMKDNEGEHQTSFSDRINRATTSIFSFINGSIGCITHSFLLHGTQFDTEIEIIADGIRIVITDPYNAPRIAVRYPHSEQLVDVSISHNDMYLQEIESFIQTIRDSSLSNIIKSPYHDAINSYIVTSIITQQTMSSK